MDSDKTVTVIYETPVRTLTVASASPDSGVDIAVIPNDKDGQGDGFSQFARIYDNNTLVALTAPATAAGGTFQSWSGCPNAIGTTCNVTMDGDKTVTAIYERNLSAPDLFGSWIYLEQQCINRQKGIQCKINGKFSVWNIGYEDAASSIQFFLSNDGAYDEGDTLLRVLPSHYPPTGDKHTEMKTGTLKPGKAKVKNMKYNLPPGVHSSGKYIIAVIDPDNAIDEGIEDNNIFVHGPLP